MTHGVVLAIAYATVCVLWWGVSRAVPLWRDVDQPRFAKPWHEVGIALLAGIGVLLLGQLWQRGIRLNPKGTITESINQLVIFSPMLAVPLIRRQGWASAWVQPRALGWRVVAGLVFALVALALFSTLQQSAPSWIASVGGVFLPPRVPIAVQVLLEDLSIAILFVRLAAALGSRYAMLLVALLFAAGHIPTLAANGVTGAELLGVLRDAGLGLLVIGTLARSADVAWFWPVHYALDMTQFLTRSA